MPSDVNGHQPEFLNSWKEIANYMGRGVRTVQRYEAQFGLPVRRPAGKSRSSVIATRAEIDAWVAAAPYRETYRLSKSTDSSNDPRMNAVMSGLQEMQKLREHMLELRAETKAALRVFLSSLQSLHGKMNSTLPASNLVGLPSLGGELDFWMEEHEPGGRTSGSKKVSSMVSDRPTRNRSHQQVRQSPLAAFD